MQEVFHLADELGPAKIIHVHEPTLGLRATLVVDNIACGASSGGLRMAPDVSTAECVRLARAMTLKNAAAGLPHGGGKSVLYAAPRLPRDQKERLIRAFAHALRNEGVSRRHPIGGVCRHEEKVRANTAAVLDGTIARGIPPRQAALDLATGRVKQAMSYRRFSVF